MQTQNPIQAQRDIISVSQLNRRARQLLETHMSLLWVEGEISNLACPSSGHWYFTLKDANAQVKCAMFRNRNQRVRHMPQHGQQVLLRARVSLYEGRGDYQLIVEHLEDAGEGALQRAFEELKLRLHQEGLFDPAYKKPLPALPRHIGIITSPTGAAIRDILHVMQRRFPSIPVSIFPVAVQGAEAAGQIVRALHAANTLSSCDLLIVGRGGGSLEDLWPFNEEIVARAIFASQLPVISAVGHEVDITIADYVADARAPTPSAAAEICTPDGRDMLQQFIGYGALLEDAIARRLSRSKERLTALSARLQHPGQKLRAQAQQLDNLEIRLRQTMHRKLQINNHQLQNLTLRREALNPTRLLQQYAQQVSYLGQRLQASMQHKLQKSQQVFEKNTALLDSVNPLSILKRGYSVTTDKHQRVLRNTRELQVGDALVTQLSDGKVQSTVDKIIP
ncbi:exodeoxyribonuclease VII large subunit [Aestuariicella hydrocarbonica]|uniref:Exodeoxyribonuclease 7 large subunit n=1 Tax=Pseudomaricurvus hydrocarbonicus TaxID=1470433 RepID=A0A9E5MFY0_9GAMM|nr:exodeoxyribonuclease VII large subunit [Aestuariicella hydrocarbonica]NHO63981.1 exodeoxyribonuclease VII large subunit [Aestuariicella hydrocarbonica]